MAIRQLRDDESVPTGEPRRYPNAAGYVRLRWHVGPNEYVEVYERRLVAGRPAGRDVHHRDDVKSHNDASNLVISSKASHARHHARQRAIQAPPQGRRRRREQQARVAERARWVAQLAAEYEAGDSTVALGKRHDRHPAQISRLLRSAGVKMRNTNPSQATARALRERASEHCERCGRVTVYEGGQGHHRDPRGMGGTRRPDVHSLANLLWLCFVCHNDLEQHRTAAKLRGWLIPDGADPTLYPLLYRGRWSYLTADGGVTPCPPEEAFALAHRL